MTIHKMLGWAYWYVWANGLPTLNPNIYIYIYRERERERERDLGTLVKILSCRFFLMRKKCIF